MTEYSWDWDFAREIAPILLRGMALTVAATVVGMTLAVVFGLFLALGRRSSRRWVSLPFIWFIEFVRSTPLLIQLFFLFYALPKVDALGNITMSPFVTLVVGLGIHFGCYASEAYRAGIQSVPVGQWEASISLNMSRATTWRSIIIPQAIPRTLPILGNYFISMFKEAPLGASIAVAELLFEARAIGSITFRFVEPLTMAGVLFLMVSIPAAWLVRRLERRVAYET